MQPASAAILALIPLRLLNAYLAGVADCDETYNYWEAVCVLAAPHPVRRPLQTWEYAPEFALRSWAYVLPYAAISRIVDNSFLAVRLCCIALPFALAEASLVKGAHARFGSDTAWALLGLLASSAGHAAAAPALVPSATIAALAAWSQGRWLRGDRRGAVFLAVLATLWPGWPFVAVLFVPLAVDVLLKDGLREALLLGVASGLFVLIPCAAFDAKAYGHFTSPLWNVITYNACLLYTSPSPRDS